MGILNRELAGSLLLLVLVNKGTCAITNVRIYYVSIVDTKQSFLLNSLVFSFEKQYVCAAWMNVFLMQTHRKGLLVFARFE